MIKINSAQDMSKELRKVRHFSSIVIKKLKSESINSENINNFTIEELTDINKILSLSNFLLTKYENKKHMRLILEEFVDLITKSANSLESIDDEVEEMLISSTTEILRLKNIQRNFSKKNDPIFNENESDNEQNSKNSVNNLTRFSTDIYSPNCPSKIPCNPQ
jgi:hypothetical protein